MWSQTETEGLNRRKLIEVSKWNANVPGTKGTRKTSQTRKTKPKTNYKLIPENYIDLFFTWHPTMMCSMSFNVHHPQTFSEALYAKTKAMQAKKQKPTHVQKYSTVGYKKSVTRFSLVRRSVNLFSVAERTNAFTNGVDRPWVVGREFESHVHIETRFLKKSEFAHVNNLKNASRSCDGLKATN